MSKIDEAIELLKKAHLNIPDGITKAQDAICAALDLLEAAKAEQPEPGEFTKEFRHLAGCFWKSSNKMERVQTKIIEACDIIDRLTAENKAQAERIEKLEKALDTMLQAFDPEHPAACDQECFDTSDGHGYEMQDLAKSRAWQALGKKE